MNTVYHTKLPDERGYLPKKMNNHTKTLLSFAIYYFALSLFGPNPTPANPNEFSVYMLGISLVFGVLAVSSYLADAIIDIWESLFTKEPSEQSVDFVGLQVGGGQRE